MGDIRVVLLDMDTEIMGQVTCNNDGSYTIFINARLSCEMQKEIYKHEYGHIINGDFDKKDADSIEFNIFNARKGWC